MNPALVPIRVLDMQPRTFTIENFKGNSLLNAEEDFFFGTRPGADIAQVFIGDDRRNFPHKKRTLMLQKGLRKFQ